MTVIIPTRNRRAFLEQAIRDTLRQRDVSLELIVVDDGSTIDGGPDGIEELGGCIRVVRHETRRGVAAARNTGISCARGGWVAFFDDDDRWSPSKLRTQIDAASKVNARWAYGGAFNIDAHDRVLLVSPGPEVATVMSYLRRYNAIPGGGSNVIARADLVRDVGGFDERLALIADWDLWIRLAEEARPAVCEEPLAAYRLHPQNMHVCEIETLDSELSYIAHKYRTAPLGHRVQPDLRFVLAYQADVRRRTGHRSAAARLYLRRSRITHDVLDVLRALTGLLGERIDGVLRRGRRRERPARPTWLEDRDHEVDGATEALPPVARSA